jgi:hypothetical protein
MAKRKEHSTWICLADQTEQKGKFCNQCGKPRPVVTTCPKCSHVIDMEIHKFCEQCGTKIEPVVEPIMKKKPAFARMFHPHNGRDGFDPASPRVVIEPMAYPNLPQATRLRAFLYEQLDVLTRKQAEKELNAADQEELDIVKQQVAQLVQD